jgi:hypothetical protein
MKLLTNLFAVIVGVSLSTAYAASEKISVTSSEFRIPVVELYTSEGCSSCPRADSWLRQLGESLDQDFRAVPLAFHVDYWNYLGWVDPFSKPAFTERQRDVAGNNRQRNIYTPEFLVDGREARGGSGIIEAIQQANSQKAEVTIELSIMRSGLNRIEASLDVNNRSSLGNTHAYVAIFESGISREIGAGENHGKVLRHDFVVRHWSEPITIHRGDNSTRVDLEIPPDWSRSNLGLAVVVLDRDRGGTLQAVSMPLVSLFES